MSASPSLHARPAETSLPVEHLFDLAVELEAPYVFETPLGTRATYITKAGTIHGPRLKGRLMPGGGDWVVVGADGVSRMDIRGTIRTHDDALIHLTSAGVVRLPADGRERIARGERIPFQESYIRTTPRFETSDERYAWLNGVVSVGINEFSAGRIDFRVYRVA